MAGEALEALPRCEPHHEEAVPGQQPAELEQPPRPAVGEAAEGGVRPQIRSKEESAWGRRARLARRRAIEVQGALLGRVPAVGKQGRDRLGASLPARFWAAEHRGNLVPASPARPLVSVPRDHPGDLPRRAASTVPAAVVSGSGGLVGSECVRRLVESGWDVIGLECDLRAQFFGPEASTAAVSAELADRYDEFRWLEVDIRDTSAVDSAFSSEADRIELVVHTAAQPSHDWAARDPQTDFGVNANGTLNLLEATRASAPTPPSCSAPPTRSTATHPTGCRSSELDARLELPRDHPWFEGHRHDDVDRSLDPLPLRRFEGGCRPAGAGVRPLLRHADGLLPRRLPDRARSTPAPSCTASSPT